MSTVPHDADEFLTAYLEAADRYNVLVDELSQLADGSHHAAFLVCHDRVKRLRIDVEEARTALEKHREDLKRSGYGRN